MFSKGIKCIILHLDLSLERKKDARMSFSDGAQIKYQPLKIKKKVYDLKSLI